MEHKGFRITRFEIEEHSQMDESDDLAFRQKFEDALDNRDRLDPEGEAWVLQKLSRLVPYLTFCVKTRWPEAEQVILSNKWATLVGHYAIAIDLSSWPEGEALLLEEGQPDEIYEYCLRVVKGPWAAAEPILAQEAIWASRYATRVLKKPFPEAHTTILDSQDPHALVPYLKQWGRLFPKTLWKEFEELYFNHSTLGLCYVEHVLKARWPIFESTVVIPDLDVDLYIDYLGATSTDEIPEFVEALRERGTPSQLVDYCVGQQIALPDCEYRIAQDEAAASLYCRQVLDRNDFKDWMKFVIREHEQRGLLSSMRDRVEGWDPFAEI